MIFSPLNIEKMLIHERMRQLKLMDEVHDILDDAVEEDKKILERLKSAASEKGNHLILVPADQARIFSITEIQKICIRFRLRFLDSSFYKNEFPYEAVSEIKSFERKYGITVEKFRIIAPDHAFNLEDINKDPLLFAQLSEGSFYLLHKWGKDLAWYKKYLFLPLQTPLIFFLTLLFSCAVVSISIPVAWLNILSFTSEVYLRIWFSLHLFIMFTGICIWSGMAFDKNFSCYTWNSKYFNG